jgi:hypothetical protein
MKAASLDQELESLKTVLHALEPLDETQRRFVLKESAERLGISGVLPAATGNNPARQGGGTPASGGVTAATGGGGSSPDGQTAKQFLKTKSPITDVQRIACLAYYLTNARNTAHFKTVDLTSLNIEAGGTRLTNPHLTVKNATNQNRYLAPVGSGSKQITSLGEDVVDALPDQEAVKVVVASQKKPRKKNAKKTAAKGK